MTKNNIKILAECCKTVLINEANRQYDNDHITSSQCIRVENKINKMSNVNVLKLVFNEAGISELEPDDHRAMKYSAALVGGSMAADKLKKTKFGQKMGLKGDVANFGGAAIAALALYLVRKAMNPCVRKAAMMKGGLRERKIAVHECHADALKKVIADLVSQLPKCAAAKNPSRCHSDMEKVLDHWKQKYHEEIIKINKLKIASA